MTKSAAHLRGPSFVPDPIRRALDPGKKAPKAAHVLYFVALGALVAVEVVEWPLALVIAAGHVLMHSSNPVLKEAGEGLDEA